MLNNKNSVSPGNLPKDRVGLTRPGKVPGPSSFFLGDGNNLKASLVQRHPLTSTGTTETILGGFKNTETHELFVLFLDAKVGVAIYHVSKLVRPSEVARLGDLPNDNCIGVVFFTPVGDLLEATLGSLTSDSTR